MGKIKLSEAQKRAKKIIEKMAAEEIEKNPTGADVHILFLIRDCMSSQPLDVYEMEAYDDYYDVDIKH